MSTAILVYHLLVIFFLVTVLGNFLLNQLVVPRLRSDAVVKGEAPFVSILVPARNEEACIQRCLLSLQAQDYLNFEIILLDDQSTDATNSIARDLGFSEESAACKIIGGKPLEDGWIGKPWACHQLSQAARGDYFLFIDADTEHAPFALRASMAEATKSRADLLTVWPEQETGTWSEKLIIPILYIAAAGMVPHWLVRLGQKFSLVRNCLSPKQWRGMGVANGQFVLFSRAGYERMGGHVGVKNHMVEDVSLGRTAAEKIHEGMVLVNCDGTGVVKTRMYRSFSQVWEGFTKNAWPVFDGNFVVFAGGLILQLLVFVLPLFLLSFGGSASKLVLAQVLLIVLIRAVMTLRYRSGWLSVLAHPFGFLLATAIAINSFRQSRLGGLTWKGRVYQVK